VAEEGSAALNTLAFHYPHGMNSQFEFFMSEVQDVIEVVEYPPSRDKDSICFSLTDIEIKKDFLTTFLRIPEVQQLMKGDVRLPDILEIMKLRNTVKLAHFGVKKTESWVLNGCPRQPRLLPRLATSFHPYIDCFSMITQPQ
jgi:hypothetical protein